jgi:uncharacterized membrane protein
VYLRFLELIRRVRASYWFIPSLMALAAFVLSIVLVSIDLRLGRDWIDDIPWLYANEPEGARAMLSTIAGSVISVAGVTFSITIAALSLASSQYGPRLIAGFMRDRGNQFVLGTYTSTFLYCLLILRTIRGSESASFVPHLAIIVGLALAILSVGVLIYFIHHVSQTIRVSYVIHQVSQTLHRRIDALQSSAAQPAHAVDGGKWRDLPEDFGDRAVTIRSRRAGYVQVINDSRLVTLAVKHDLLIRVQSRPGDFVVDDGELLQVLGLAADDAKVRNQLIDTYLLGIRRTDSQDVISLVQQLVEVAARAISPGINDPFTAVTCIDWLTAAFSRLAAEDIPSAYRYDDNGTLRLVFEPATFEEFIDAAFDPLREYGRGMVEIVVRLLQSIEAISRRVSIPQNRETLSIHAHAIYSDALAHLSHESDRSRVETQFRVTMASVSGNIETDNTALQRVPNLPQGAAD